MLKHKILRLFERRRGLLDYRIKRDYVRNGIATIPCRISSYNDVISTYSVKGYETLNTEFYDYLTSTAEVTPPEYPLVLNIIGDCLSAEEKKTIEDIIRDDFAYNLGMVEKDEKRHVHNFFFTIVGLVLSGVLMWLTEAWLGQSGGLAYILELIYILFWFMGEMLCDYIFLSGHDLRQARRVAGRLASIKVVFSDSYEDRNYTQSQVDELYSEIEKEVYETIRQEEE